MGKEEREAYLMAAIGAKGTGKTYQNMHVIKDYVRDKLTTGVRGRKVLIFDTNGEYTKESFQRANIPNFEVKKIGIKDVVSFSRQKTAEARRIDARTLDMEEKIEVIRYVIQNFKGGMLVLEDINSYTQSVFHIKQIVSSIIKARHDDLDILISYQSLRRLDPIMWANTTWVRLHHQLGSVAKYADRASSEDLVYIANYLVDNMYRKDPRFFLYIQQYDSQIIGNFNKESFSQACIEYLSFKRALVKEQMFKANQSKEDAIKAKIEYFISEYYGNKN